MYSLPSFYVQLFCCKTWSINTVMASLNIIVGQITDMSQQKNKQYANVKKAVVIDMPADLEV